MTTDQTAAPPSDLGQLPNDRHHVHFVTRPDSHPLITVDGVDIAKHISGIQIVPDAVAGTRVAIEVPRHRLEHTEFDGIAVVEINTYSDDPGPAAAAFIGALDPELLEKAMLRREDLTNEPYGGTAAMLRQIVDWANGEGAT